jgi:methionyl-tRNA formyltransferase
VAVISQPDRRRGRGRKLAPTPVRSLADELEVDLLQPQKVGEPASLEWMRSRAPDLGIVVAFGQFIPKSVRELPRCGLINAHASLLPRWRGAAPIEWAIREGDAVTGISVMRVVKEMDAGGVCLRRETPIDPAETAGELAERLANLAAEALVAALEPIAAGEAVFEPQEAGGVMLAPKVDREFARLDWDEPARRVLSRIRAATPRPGVDLVLRRAGVRLRILRARLWEGAEPAPGRVRAVYAADGRLAVAALDGWIEVLTLQVPGRRPVTVPEFLRGADVQAGEEVTPE